MLKKRPTDPRGAHVRLYADILDSPAWAALSYSQQALYITMRRRLTSNNNGNIACTVTWLRDRGVDMSSSTLAAGLRALVAVGLIQVSRPGGMVGRGQSIATLYRFTDEPSHEWKKLFIDAHLATREWSKLSSLVAARQAIEKANTEAQNSAAEKREKKRRREI